MNKWGPVPSYNVSKWRKTQTLKRIDCHEADFERDIIPLTTAGKSMSSILLVSKINGTSKKH